MINKVLYVLLIFLFISLSAKAQFEFNISSDSLDIMIGQMIMSGVNDNSYLDFNEPILEDIRNGLVGGVVIFEKNIASKKSSKTLKKYIQTLQNEAPIPLFVTVDEEGGKVNRLKPKYGFPKTVSAAYLGKIDNIDSTSFYANQTAVTLANLGINVNYAPVLDIAINPKNPIIAGVERSYSDNANIVAKHAIQVVKSHSANGIVTVLKHFPGHGSSHADTHMGIADVSDYWQFNELMPYKYLIDSGLVEGVMSAHIVNKHLDPNRLPGTLSPVIIKDILRGVLNYEGVIFSDDMQMHAISKEYGFEESIKMAILAGIDVLMFANNVPGNEKRRPSEIHKIIKGMVMAKEITTDRIQSSYDRIMALKQKFNIVD
jgi:beta-N-acetylhexosaminidase